MFETIELAGFNTAKDAALDALVAGFEAGVEGQKLNGQHGPGILREAFILGHNRAMRLKQRKPNAHFALELCA